MTLRIGSNISSLQAQRRLGESTLRLTTSFERLSSGQRINRASDDAAGLAIAEKLHTDSRIYNQAIRNVNDGLSYLNIADGALEQIAHITTRQRELAAQSANGVYSATQRKAMTAEANALVAEYNRIVQSTEFNGRRVLDVQSSGEDLRIQAGYGVEGSVALGIGTELARRVGTGNFSAPANLPTDTYGLYGLAAGDLDGDGSLDMVTAGYSSTGFTGEVQVRFNDGQGNFSSPATYVADPAYASYAVALSDLNGDSSLDIVSVGDGGKSLVMLNDGRGSFTTTASYSSAGGGSEYALSLCDINGDGTTDLVTAGNAISVRLNDGRGAFGAVVSYATDGYPGDALSLTDINGDAVVDLIVMGADASFVRLNDGHGTFGRATTYDSIYSNYGLAVTDVNGDGAADLITAGEGPVSGRVTIQLNDGSGNFGAGHSYSTNPGDSLSLLASDINGDGAPDLLLGGMTQGTDGELAVLLNDGRGTFGNPVSWPATDPLVEVVAGDVNGDGVADIMALANNGPSIYIASGRDVATVATLDLFSRQSSRQALTILQDQQDRISAERGLIGSFQRRLSVALNTIAVSRENADAARSRITDADVAQESAELTRNQILQQAGAAVLGQANQQPSLALQLLRG